MGVYTAVLYDQNDVDRYFRDEIAGEVKEILPLTPAATAALDSADQRGHIPVLDPLKAHSNFGHCRDVLVRLRLERFLEARLAEERGLSKAGKHALVTYALDACGISSRIWTTLKGSQAWLIPMPDAWLRTSDRRAAHRALVERFIEPYATDPALKQVGATPLYLWLILFFLNALFCLKVARTKPIFFNAFARGFGELIANLQRQDPRLWALSFNPLRATGYSFRYILTWLRWAITAKGIPVKQVTLTVPPRKTPRQLRIARRVLLSVEEPVARAGIEAMLPFILCNVEWVESILPAYRILLRLAGARAALAWDHADRLNAALGEAAQTAHIPSIAVCHTSVSQALDRISLAAKGRRTRDLGSGPLADIAVVQSPYADAAAKQTRPEIPKVPVQPVVWGNAVKTMPATAPGGKKERVVLHASNYFEWSAYLPWAYETFNDFVDNLRSLVVALGDVPDARLVIRMKSNFGRKAEFSVETLRKLLAPTGRWEARETGSFYEDLQQADLVVCFHSTTIEEALLARKPALLLGGRGRYRHLPARTKLPTAVDRAAVYAHERSVELTQLLAGILDSHAGHPLTDEELRKHVWPPGTPSIAEFAQELVNNSFTRL